MGSVDRNTGDWSRVWEGIKVAPRMGSVDRNPFQSAYFAAYHVAPRMGSVDRNSGHPRIVRHPCVAPRMGSVDRNLILPVVVDMAQVAPRMGSVDRNGKGKSPIVRAARRSPHGERG